VQIVSGLSMKIAAQNCRSQIYAIIIEKVVEDGVGMHIPPEITKLSDNFVDIILDKLSKVLLPRRIVAHEIDLDQGIQPPTRDSVPYRLFGLELEELNRQLTELINTGFYSTFSMPLSSFKKRRTQRN
jgi:hypothetical protein